MKVNLDTIIIAYDIMQSSNPWLSEQFTRVHRTSLVDFPQAKSSYFELDRLCLLCRTDISDNGSLSLTQPIVV